MRRFCRFIRIGRQVELDGRLLDPKSPGHLMALTSADEDIPPSGKPPLGLQAHPVADHHLPAEPQEVRAADVDAGPQRDRPRGGDGVELDGRTAVGPQSGAGSAGGADAVEAERDVHRLRMTTSVSTRELTTCPYSHSIRPSPSSTPSRAAMASRRGLNPPARLSSSRRRPRRLMRVISH